ncbi:MAG: hypothetical protein K1X28_01765 [Parachlamydiales bacterium]|nr:hypothetical protein [Parachlamydiales bacterium]
MKIVYQGAPLSYSHKALEKIDGEKAGLATFRDVYEAVSSGKADLGLLPIENALIGTIYETIDLLAEGDLKIVGELTTKVDHCLMALSGAKIQKVISHPKALEQCTNFIKEHPEWEIVPYYDTAGAAIAASKDPSLAALAPEGAAQEYGLEIVQKNMQDHEQNYTRFFLISKTAAEGRKKTLCFTLEHKPGSLAAMLAKFAESNLTHIVSRPILGKPFEYLFYVDLEGPIPNINAKHLGSYETISHWRD